MSQRSAVLWACLIIFFIGAGTAGERGDDLSGAAGVVALCVWAFWVKD